MEEVGDSPKTFALWKECNRFKNGLDDEIQVAETKLAAVKPLNQQAPLRFQNIRNKQLQKVYNLYAKAYKTYATSIRSANSERADPLLIYHILKRLPSPRNFPEFTSMLPPPWLIKVPIGGWKTHRSKSS